MKNFEEKKYGSSITRLQVEVAEQYGMKTKTAMMFGWHLCQALENNEYHHFQDEKWFTEFLEMNNIRKCE